MELVTFCDCCTEVKVVQQYGDNWHCDECKTEFVKEAN